MNRTLIISGGNIDDDFALEFLEKNSFQTMIGVDGGVLFCYQNGIRPTHIVGDFDSAPSDIIEYYRKDKGIQIRSFCPEKDLTDTQIAIELAIELSSTEICILGGTGTRIDHLLGNIQNLSLPLKNQIPAYLIDAHNKICLLDHEVSVKKEELFGKYISLIPLTTQVTGVTLTGFKYPLYDHTLKSDESLGISNEIVEKRALIRFSKGVLIMIQSND